MCPFCVLANQIKPVPSWSINRYVYWLYLSCTNALARILEPWAPPPFFLLCCNNYSLYNFLLHHTHWQPLSIFHEFQFYFLNTIIFLKIQIYPLKETFQLWIYILNIMLNADTQISLLQIFPKIFTQNLLKLISLE